MSILDKANLTRTRRTITKHCGANISIRNATYDLGSSYDEYILELRVSASFAANKKQSARFTDAYETAQKTLLYIIYGDLLNLIQDLKLSVYNSDEEEMLKIIKKMETEIGI